MTITSRAVNLKRYFDRINFKGEAKSDLSTLKQLHKLHLLHIPFENLDIHFKKKIVLNIEAIEKKIVDENRGGFCYEMNGLLYAVLTEIGFEVTMVSARVFETDGMLGKEFDHLALLVKLNVIFLVDVGFGANFTEPIQFITELEQRDETGFYKITERNDDEYLLSFKQFDGDYSPQYIFTKTPRRLDEFNEMCEYHQTSPDSHFTQKKVCTRLTENGRITLSDGKLITTIKGEKKIQFINPDEEKAILFFEFGIKI